MQSKQQLTVVKIGGDILDNDELLSSFYTNFTAIRGLKLLIHGGGNYASSIQQQLGSDPKKINGRRITDAAALDIVVMVYAGLINKKIVAGLQASAINAIGLTGADGDAIRAHKREIKKINYGFVGDVDLVNSDFIDDLLSGGKTPVFSAITHDGNGQLLNTNADTLASRIASAMSIQYNVQLYYCFTKAGVLKDISDETSIIAHIDSRLYSDLKAKGKITDGMLPKLKSAFEALDRGVLKIHLGAVPMLNDTKEKHTTLCL